MIGLMDLVSTPEVCKMLGISKQRVAQLIAKGGFPEPVATLAVGRIWLREDIERWAEARNA